VGAATIPRMSGERVWGRRLWVWRAHALVAVACLVLALVSQTESGRIFPLMVIVAQLFLAGTVYLRWRQAQHVREVWGIDEDGVWTRP
jgi:hypothetical protein